MTAEPVASRRNRTILWSVMLVLSTLLLFRPNEDIFGGEDPGSYINAAVSYARNNSFFYIDPLLSQVAPEARNNFLYGNTNEYGVTKNACLWVRDMDRALIGPHFFPAYPLLMSGVTGVFPDLAALFVIPLFTVFMALALRALASLLSGFRWAGLAAFLLFLACPLVVWHGRNPRPEIIASFMFFGGFTMLLNAWQHQRWVRWYDILLGSVCVGLAPFFHVTSLALVIGATVVVCLLIISGRDDFLPFLLVGYGLLVVFAAQAKFVTNYYHIYSFVGFILERYVISAVIFGFIFILLCALCFSARRVSRVASLITSENTVRAERIACRIFAGVTVLVFLFLYLLKSKLGGLALKEHYLYLVDMGTAINALSGIVCFAALVGWTVLLLNGKGTVAMRLAFGLIVFPAMLAAGKMTDFFMTRYLMVAFVPVMILSLVSILNLIKIKSTAKSLVFTACFIALFAFTFSYNRLHLVTFRAHKGVTAFLGEMADEIKKKENSILLCEYSRLAGPFEHVFGIPTLGIDNERLHDYTQIEQAWERIMLSNPETPAFFLTPFEPPLSDFFEFDEIMDHSFTDAKIQQAGKSLPDRIRKSTIRLRLYAMRPIRYRGPPFDVYPPAEYLFPFVRLPGEGNVGFRNFSKTRYRNWEIKGAAVSASGISVQLPAERAERVLFVFKTASLVTNPDPPVITGEYGAETQKERWHNIFDDWWIYEIAGTPLSINSKFEITSRLPAHLMEVFTVSSTNVLRGFTLLDDLLLENIPVSGMPAKWTRATAEILLPFPETGDGVILLHVWAPDTGGAFNVSVPDALDTAKLKVQPEEWRWIAVPFSDIETLSNQAWIKISTDNPWDSDVEGFPHDLGILVNAVVVLPNEY